MAQVGKVYKCESCGNMVVVIKEGGNPNLNCCGQDRAVAEI